MPRKKTSKRGWNFRKPRVEKIRSNTPPSSTCISPREDIVQTSSSNVEVTEICNSPRRESLQDLPKSRLHFEDDEDDLPDLEVEYVRTPGQYDRNIENVSGRRVVDISHFITAVRGLEKHACRISRTGHFSFKKEIRLGLNSKLIFQCTSCQELTVITTNKIEEDEPNINLLASWGAIANGKSHYYLEEAFSLLDIPPFSNKVFLKCQAQLGEAWQEALTVAVQEAGEEEYNRAIEKNNFIEGPNGKIGLCTVIVDGGWSHRSYGHRYSAKSGVACIIGKETKKLLFLGIRNKYCCICAIAGREKKTVPEHRCYKNWSGSSPAMETDIIVEGFCKSEAMHNLQYTYFIGDGDSSVHTKILETVPYSRKIKKIECANHLTKNVTKHLFKLAKESALNRKFLSNATINQIGKTLRKLITIHSKKGTPSPQQLQADLTNVANHVFGNHNKCTKDYCFKVGQESDGVFKNIPLELRLKMARIIGNLSARSSSLVSDETSNRAELFMHQVAKWNSGKQTFYGRRNSFNIRCHGAGLAYQYGPEWIIKSFKAKFGRSPPNILKRLATKRRKIQQRRKPKRRLFFLNEKSSTKIVHYGPACSKPDLPAEEINKLIKEQVNMLNTSVEAQQEIEKSTRGQSNNPNWFEARKCRLTASLFGNICKRKANHGKLVENILYKYVPQVKQLEYGTLNEPVAIAAYSTSTKNVVDTCGLFVCTDDGFGFLGASPDGLVGTDKIIEIKCPYSARIYTPLEAATKIKTFCCKLSEDGKSMKLKTSHNYYYQIQGQMHMTKRKFCDFVIWTPKGIHIETIQYNENFVQNMLQKLKKFYYEHFAVEMADSRHERSMPLRNSGQIVES